MNFSTKVKTLLYSMDFSHGARRALMTALALIYFLSFGFNVIAVTTMFAISTIVLTLFEFPTGAIADYDSRKKSIMISFFLMSVAFFGLFIFKDFWLLSASWILGDIAWTFYSGAGSAWSMDALKYGKKKNKIVSLISKSYFFEKGGQIIGGLIGLIVVAINFSFVWLFVSILYLFMFFVIWKYMEERNFKPEKAENHYLMKTFIKAKESFSYLIHKKNRQLRVLLLGSSMGNFSFAAFWVAMPLFFTEIMKLSPEKLSGILSVVAALTLAGPIIAEKMVHKLGIKKSMITAVASVSILAIVFALSNSLIISLGILVILNCFLVAVSVIEDSAHQHLFDPKIRASLGSTASIIWSIAYSLSVFLTGYSLAWFGIVPTLVISGSLTFLEAVIYIWWLK